MGADLNTTSAGIISRTPCKAEGLAVWRESDSSLRLLGSHLTGWHANPLMLMTASSKGVEGATWTVRGNPTHKGYSYDSQPTYVAPIEVPASPSSSGGRLLLYLGDRWNQASESGPGSVGGAAYIWLPLLHNATDKTGLSLPLLGGRWNGTGRWRVADYLAKSGA